MDGTRPSPGTASAADGVDPFVRRQHVERHPRDHVIRRHAGKIDTGQFACRAAATVGADEILRRQLVGAVRVGDVDRDTVGVLVEANQPVTPTDIGIVFNGPVGEHLHKPGLLDGKHKGLGIRHQRLIQRKGGEHRTRRALRRLRGPCERVVEAAVVQGPDALADDAVRARLRVGPRHRVQHHRPDTGQSQFAGQHQSIRASACDDNVDHLAS
jgi:hypothetical protein